MIIDESKLGGCAASEAMVKQLTEFYGDCRFASDEVRGVQLLLKAAKQTKRGHWNAAIWSSYRAYRTAGWYSKDRNRYIQRIMEAAELAGRKHITLEDCKYRWDRLMSDPDTTQERNV